MRPMADIEKVQYCALDLAAYLVQSIPPVFSEKNMVNVQREYPKPSADSLSDLTVRPV